MRNIAVILLAGSSKRFRDKTPKQFFEVNAHPLCYYSIKPFVDSKTIDEIVLVSKEEYFGKLKEIISPFNKQINLVKGGETRYESVSNALKYLSENFSDDDNILVHDGARLFVNEEQIISLADSLNKYQASTLAIPMEDTIATTLNDEIKEVPDRSNYVRIQTPQAFKLKTLKCIHMDTNISPSDDAQLCLSKSIKVAILLGSKKLNKVTTKEDINNIKAILENEK